LVGLRELRIPDNLHHFLLLNVIPTSAPTATASEVLKMEEDTSPRLDFLSAVAADESSEWYFSYSYEKKEQKCEPS
jgi:hypothetical protein